jgi:hemolysin III
MSATVTQHKPLMRGVSHQVFFFIALAAGAVLVAFAPTTRLGCLVYAFSLAGLLGISALYHRRNWGTNARQWMRRLDHAAIVVLIAGTGTPFALQLASPSRERFLLVIWTGAAIGALRAMLWVNAPKLLVTLIAIALGWAAVPFVPELRQAVGSQTFAWLLVGGVLYSAGAVAYATKRPNPWPRVFGYHEVFHAFVIAASICHFVAVARAVGMAMV